MTDKIFENEDELSAEAKMNILLVLMADTRKRISELVAEKTKFENENPGYMQILQDLADLRKNAKEIYEAITSFAIEHYTLTGEESRKINTWVSVVPKEVAEYNPADAVKWAVRKELYTLLVIDESEFLSVAKTLGVDFVNYRQDYAIRLASDLTELESAKRLEE